jgi:hypothetical protein
MSAAHGANVDPIDWLFKLGKAPASWRWGWISAVGGGGACNAAAHGPDGLE